MSFREPSDNEKRDILKALMEGLGVVQREPRPQRENLGEYPIPEEHIEAVLLAMQTAHQAGHAAAPTMRLWRLVHSIMPGTRNYSCGFSFKNTCAPAIVLRDFESIKTMKLGEDDVTEVHTIPETCYMGVLDLIDAHEQARTPLSNYHLWSFALRSVGLDPATHGGKEWRILSNAEHIQIFTYSAERLARDAEKEKAERAQPGEDHGRFVVDSDD